MPRTVPSVQSDAFTVPTARVEPTTGAEYGLHLGDLRGFRLTIAAEEGETLDGTGTMRCYVWNADVEAWLPNPALDFEVGSEVAGKRGRVFPDVEQVVPLGAQLLYVRDGVGVSDGDLTVIMQGQEWVR